MIREKRAGGLVRVLVVWFDDMPESTRGYDLLICRQRSQWLHANRWLYYYTRVFDLTQSEEQLLEQMNSTTVKEIKRAREKDGVSCSFNLTPTHVEINDFVQFTNSNARAPGQSHVVTREMEKLNDAGLLMLSRVEREDGTVLVWRANLTHVGQGRARCLYGGSLNTSDQVLRSLAGRANRLLHFNEMLFFKGLGYRIYDFGGWYAGKEDAKRLQINQFKAGFGGRVAVGYDCEEPVSLWGRLYYLTRSIVRRLFQPDQVKERARRREKIALT